MGSEEFTEEQVMLTLALISYRGIQDVGQGDGEEARLHEGIVRALERLGPVRGRWDVVWGPASYRGPLALFADSAVYVVRDRQQPSRYVVAIRGTNPLSLFDWVFGDLWADRQVAWPYGDPESHPGAALSVSSWLGLGIVQSLRSQRATGWLGDLQRLFSTRIAEPLEDFTRSVVAPLGAALDGLLRGVRRDLRRDLELLAGRREHRAHVELDGRIDAIRAERNAVLRRRVRRCVDEVLEHPEAERPPALMRLLEDESWLLGRLRGGQDLKSFLASAVREAQQEGHPAPEIVVTGHSKGGALAPTVALWLADTQGEEDIAPADRWDPAGDARITCYAFAGPTAGNRAYAKHSDAVIGERCHRIANRLDIVPHAWVARSVGTHTDGNAELDLRQLAGLYESAVKWSPETARIFTELVEEVASEVEGLDYVHVGKQVKEFPGRLDSGKSQFLEQALHQHVEAYIQELGLEGELSLLDLATLL